MNKKELQTILNCITTAQDAISLLACDKFPYTAFHDNDLKEMFYQLNEMGLKIYEKIENLAETA